MSGQGRAGHANLLIYVQKTGHSAQFLQGWQLLLPVLQGQWDSTWDVEALRGAKKDIEGARKIKVQKLRADQVQERRDLEARHKRAVEEVRPALDLPVQQADLALCIVWQAAGRHCLVGSCHAICGRSLEHNSHRCMAA